MYIGTLDITVNRIALRILMYIWKTFGRQEEMLAGHYNVWSYYYE
jgi:hypothetical protein